VTFITSVD